jgi:hypothetical protein
MKFSNTIYKRYFLFIVFGVVLAGNIKGQPVPGKDENIPFLVTFGKEGKTSWGDDDFYQIYFFAIPAIYAQQFYIRVFDPDCGGENDEIQGDFNSKTMFSVYGGKGVDPDKYTESQGLFKGENFKKGNLLSSKVFGNEPKYDNKYYSFGPFSAKEGDYSEKYNMYIFKIVCEGIAGDDGNLFRYFLSRDPNNNLAIEGAIAYTYKYHFRMWNDFKSVSHIYPYIDTGIIYVQQNNFDWDDDGQILVVSKLKQGISVPISNDNDKADSKIPIDRQEFNSSLDFQFHKKQGALVKNNNVVIVTKNQRGEGMPFYAAPIGGVPVYVPKTKIEKLAPKK